MTEKSNDYQRGYAAGRRREHREEQDIQRHHELKMARYTLAAAVAPEIIRSPWHRNGKPLTSTDEVAGTIASIVKAIERKL
ncbi:MAG: hypothetical protein WBL20_07785 [Sphingobium sp.]|uniref:hypothetical protein n=1 Tax=Sphingobium sp. TaxID=1912891 RepID=UPI003BAEAB32